MKQSGALRFRIKSRPKFSVLSPLANENDLANESLIDYNRYALSSMSEKAAATNAKNYLAFAKTLKTRANTLFSRLLKNNNLYERRILTDILKSAFEMGLFRSEEITYNELLTIFNKSKKDPNKLKPYIDLLIEGIVAENIHIMQIVIDNVMKLNVNEQKSTYLNLNVNFEPDLANICQGIYVNHAYGRYKFNSFVLGSPVWDVKPIQEYQAEIQDFYQKNSHLLQTEIDLQIKKTESMTKSPSLSASLTVISYNSNYNNPNQKPSGGTFVPRSLRKNYSPLTGTGGAEHKSSEAPSSHDSARPVFNLSVSTAGNKDLEKSSPKLQELIKKTIFPQIQSEPYSPNAEKKTMWRDKKDREGRTISFRVVKVKIRDIQYRVLYATDDVKKQICIIGIGLRDGFYEAMIDRVNKFNGFISE